MPWATSAEQSRAEQVGKANAGRACTEEQVFLVLELRALELDRVDHAGKRDTGSTLHVVIVDAVLIAITLQQVDGVHSGPILEVNAAFREHLLYGLDELVHEGKELGRRGACLTHAQVKGIVQILLVVGAGIEIHGQQVLRRHARTGGVELQLADGDAGAVGAEIAEAEDAPAVRNTDEPDILLRLVSQDLLHAAAAGCRQIHAARLAIDVAELETGFPDGRIIDDRQKARRIGHYGPIEERLVVVEQIGQIGVSIKVGVLVAELRHHPAQLQVQSLGDVGHQADNSECLLFRLAEGG
jgi:hypothetical protein